MDSFDSAFSIDFSTAFYDVMFGKPDETAGTLNDLEKAVCNEISILLEHKDISSLVPTLPAQVMQITHALSDERTDFVVLEHIIESDVGLAGEVVSKANSPAYRRCEKPIENIQQAVSHLGLTGVGQIANNILMRQVLDIKPIYFKMFGKQIWDHSDQCATISRILAGDHDPGLCYLLGLLHDVGKVVMFKCLCDSFQRADPGCKPGGKLFKQMMIEYSLWLSWRIAEAWEMPESIVTALEQQRYDKQEGLGLVLHQSNFLSELSMLAKVMQIDPEELRAVFGEQGIDNATVEAVFNLLAEPA